MGRPVAHVEKQWTEERSCFIFLPFSKGKSSGGETRLPVTFGLPGLTDTGPPTSPANGDEAERTELKVSTLCASITPFATELSIKSVGPRKRCVCRVFHK